MRKTDNTLVADFGTLYPAPIGGGGFVINFDENGGVLVHGTDVNQGMIRKPGDSKWSWLLRGDNMPTAEFDPKPSTLAFQHSDNGCSAIRITPSNKNIIYAHYNAKVFKTTDGGANWTVPSNQLFFAASNTGSQRSSNRLIDVHPTDPNTVIVGTNHYAADTSKSGAFYSTNGGTTWTKITALPAASARGSDPGRTMVAIDPGQPTTAYAAVWGSGLWVCTSFPSATAWTQVSGAYATCSELRVRPNGDVFMCCGRSDGNGATNDVYRRTRAGTAFSYSTGCGLGLITIDVNPNNSSQWVGAEENGAFAITLDSGATWAQFAGFNNNFARGPGEIAWISNATGGAARVFPFMVQFDSAVANKLWVTHGIGIGSINIPSTTSGQTLTLNDFTSGNEEKVAESFQSVPGDTRPILGVWDYSIWPMNDLLKWNNRGIVPPLPGGGNGLAICKQLDYAQDDTTYRVAAIAQSPYGNAQSTDGGTTWTTIPGQSNTWNGGADIACNRKANIIIIDSNNGKGHYTKNSGTTWANIQLVPGTDDINFILSDYLNRKIVSADKTRAGVFSLVYRNQKSDNSLGEPNAGSWTTLDGGSTWTKKRPGVIGSTISGYDGDQRQFYEAELKYVPGFSGEMLYTGCPGDETGSMNPLVWLKSDGATEERLGSTVSQVHSFDFGPIAPGQTRPSVGFYGRVGGVRGLYISFDWFATTPKLITKYPMDNLSYATVVGMDKNKLGRIFCGGIGWNYWTFGQRLKVKGA